MMLQIQENVELAPHTVFKIGGPAGFFCQANSADELKEAIGWAKAKNTKFFILGAGSNVLVSDSGFDGLVIKNQANKIEVRGEMVEAEAGAQMARVVSESVKAGLTGFEWAIGIPGTIGGSVRGNAGCFGSETKDVVESVEVLDSLNARRYTLDAEKCNFSYRHSIFKENPNLIALSAVLKLEKGDPQKSQELIVQYSKKRLTSQDIGAKCAGCIFKNVEWARRDIDKAKLLKRFPELARFSGQKSIPSGFLIDYLGLKGFRIGQAQISQRHANYFINLGGASAEDVLTLISLAKEKVQNRYGTFLEEEIQRLNC